MCLVSQIVHAYVIFDVLVVDLLYWCKESGVNVEFIYNVLMCTLRSNLCEVGVDQIKLSNLILVLNLIIVEMIEPFEL